MKISLKPLKETLEAHSEVYSYMVPNTQGQEGGEMTKKEALEGCVELWDWLAENPSKAKKEWPGWDNKEVIMFCFACEYYHQTTKSDIDTSCAQECIIPVFRQHQELDTGDDSGCRHRDSLYNAWWESGFLYSDKPGRAKHAKQIADSAREELKKVVSDTQGRGNGRKRENKDDNL